MADNKELKKMELSSQLSKMESLKNKIYRKLEEITKELQKQKFSKIPVIVATHRLKEYANEHESLKKKISETCEELKQSYEEQKYEWKTKEAWEDYSKILKMVGNIEKEIEGKNIEPKSQNTPSQTCSKYIKNEFNETTTSIDQGTMTKFDSGQIKLLLPFDGEFLNFHEFFEPFLQMVDNADIPNALKLQILRQKLDGETRTWLIGLSGSGDYETAKNHLKEYFYNEYEIQTRVLSKFLKETPNQKEFDIISTRNLLVKARNAYKMLVKASSSQYVIETLKLYIVNKMASSALRSLGYVDGLSMEELFQFLEKDLKLAQKRVPMYYDPPWIKTEYRDEYVPNGKNINIGENYNYDQRKWMFCHFCNNKTHDTKECKSQLSLEEKRNIIIDKRLCWNCFGKGHPSRFCKMEQTCELCDGKHNTMFCLQQNQQFNELRHNRIEQQQGNGSVRQENMIKPAAYYGQHNIYPKEYRGAKQTNNGEEQTSVKELQNHMINTPTGKRKQENDTNINLEQSWNDIMDKEAMTALLENEELTDIGGRKFSEY